MQLHVNRAGQRSSRAGVIEREDDRVRPRDTVAQVGVARAIAPEHLGLDDIRDVDEADQIVHIGEGSDASYHFSLEVWSGNLPSSVEYHAMQECQ